MKYLSPIRKTAFNRWVIHARSNKNDHVSEEKNGHCIENGCSMGDHDC